MEKELPSAFYPGFKLGLHAWPCLRVFVSQPVFSVRKWLAILSCSSVRSLPSTKRLNIMRPFIPGSGCFMISMVSLSLEMPSLLASSYGSIVMTFAGGMLDLIWATTCMEVVPAAIYTRLLDGFIQSLCGSQDFVYTSGLLPFFHG